LRRVLVPRNMRMCSTRIVLVPRNVRMYSTRLQDPHSISNELDGRTMASLILRLESRARSSVFRNLYTTYFPRLLAGTHGRVLEVGTGTGAVVRALAKEGYMGDILGVDQSEPFVVAARELASKEGLHGLKFTLADATHLKRDIAASGDEPAFDVIILHTLISHVTDPHAVLRSAREVAKPGSVLVVVDGDYPGLSFSCQEDPELGRAMDSALVEATYAQPDIVRCLPKLFKETGWRIGNSVGTCVAEVGRELNYWRSFAEAYMPRVKDAGLVNPKDVDRWWLLQREAESKRQNFVACTYFTMIATADEE